MSKRSLRGVELQGAEHVLPEEGAGVGTVAGCIEAVEIIVSARMQIFIQVLPNTTGMVQICVGWSLKAVYMCTTMTVHLAGLVLVSTRSLASRSVGAI